MNKKQLIVFGVGVLVVSVVILQAPKHIYVPSRGTFSVADVEEIGGLPWEPVVNWDWVLQHSVPVVLICTFLILLFNRANHHK